MTAPVLQYNHAPLRSVSWFHRAGWICLPIAIAAVIRYMAAEHNYRSTMIGDDDSNHFQLIALTHLLCYSLLVGSVGAICSGLSLNRGPRTGLRIASFTVNVLIAVGSLAWMTLVRL